MSSGRRPRYSREVREALAREYHEHVARNTLPDGWVKQKAVELGVHWQTVYQYIASVEEAKPVRSGVVRQGTHFDHSQAMRGGGSIRCVHASKWEG